ncbi:DUF2066 domain-containing protein [Oleiphilus messinensis]|nr:DUF2066 domain-containing protein [Oleiphilus messinensis]
MSSHIVKARSVLVGCVWIMFLVAVFAPAAQAVVVSELYEATIPVSGKAAAVENEAFALALSQVLVKVSGDPEVLQHPDIKTQSSDPKKLIAQFGYRAGVDAANPFNLRVVFIKPSIDKMLKASGFPLWGGNRPSVLVWIAREESGQREVVGNASQQGFVEGLQLAAARRGVPAYIPVMDLQDETAVTVSDVWGLFVDPVVEASSRYNADAVVLVKTYGNSGGWSGRWMMDLKGQQFSGSFRVSSPLEVSQLVIDEIATVLAKQYAVHDALVDGEGRIELEISGVEQFRDYVGAYQYLEALAPVQSLDILRVHDGAIQVSVWVAGNEARLRQYIELDRKLVPDIVPIQSAEDTLKMYYRWNRR